MANETCFPTFRFNNPHKDPGNDFALYDNLGLVLERIEGISEMLQIATDDLSVSAIQNAGFMFQYEVRDAKALLDAWLKVKRGNQPKNESIVHANTGGINASANTQN